jgi:hypothetical protein
VCASRREHARKQERLVALARWWCVRCLLCRDVACLMLLLYLGDILRTLRLSRGN